MAMLCSLRALAKHPRFAGATLPPAKIFKGLHVMSGSTNGDNEEDRGGEGNEEDRRSEDNEEDRRSEGNEEDRGREVFEGLCIAAVTDANTKFMQCLT